MEPDRGAVESPEYGDLSAVWGVWDSFGTPRGKPYLGTHLWETNWLLLRDRSPSWIFTRFLTAARRAIDARFSFTDMRERCVPAHPPRCESGLAFISRDRDVALTRLLV